MADFTIAYKITMHNEGGYSNDTKDAGGETWRGIARKRHPEWYGWTILDSIKASHPSSLDQALAADGHLESLVLSFYKADFWDCLQLDEVRCQEIANQLFDSSVNMGQATAAVFLQKSINTFTNHSLVVDGKIGPKTVAAVNGLSDEEVYNEINVLRAAQYNAIIAAKPSDEVFRHSWFSRIRPFEGTVGNVIT